MPVRASIGDFTWDRYQIPLKHEPLRPTAAPVIRASETVVLRSLLPRLFSIVPGFGSLFGLLDVLWILNEDQRCIHDHFAGTKVVDV